MSAWTGKDPMIREFRSDVHMKPVLPTGSNFGRIIKKEPSKNSSVEEMENELKQILLKEPIFPFLILF
jgi:hypothetical protein